jgi:tRNA A37 threonylcarbamoyladenosine dehydratase
VSDGSAPDFERRFGGLRRLYGDAAFARIRAAHVCVAGIGGVGSWTAEALARSAVGRLTLIDLDSIHESNINRQIHALDGTLGQAKVEAMKARIALINPACQVETIEDFVTEDNVADLLGRNYDLVIDAIDQVRVKVAMIAWCRRHKLLLVSCGGAGGKQDAAHLHVDDLSRAFQDPLLAKVRTRLRRDHGFPREGRKMGVACVYSDEPLRRPPGAVACETDAGITGLNCAGYGSMVAVTAGFGMAAASWALSRLAAGGD